MKLHFPRRLAAGILAAVQAAALCVALPASAHVDVGTNLTDNLFHWKLYTDDSADATYTTYNSIDAIITDAGTLDYSVQLYYSGVPLYQGAEYSLTFEVSSTVPRQAALFIQEDGGDYTSYYWTKLGLSEEPLAVEYSFVMEEETDLMAKIVLNCGGVGTELGDHTVKFNQPTLTLVDDSNVDYSAFETPEKNILVNQVGYLPGAEKVAVCRGLEAEEPFTLCDAASGEAVYTGMITRPAENAGAEETDWKADFSAVTAPGTYYLQSETCGESNPFSIGADVYTDLTDSLVKMYYYQRCGTEVQDETFGHAACHTQKTVDYETGEEMDVTGGWHDAGDYGRYVTAGAKAVSDLIWAYRTNPDLFGDDSGIPESGNGVPDLLDEVRYELEWMQKMQDKETGGVHHKVTCKNFPGYVMPEEETDTLYVTPVSTMATADFAAVMAMGSQEFREIDPDFAAACLEQAEAAWAYLEENPDKIFENPADISTGTYSDNSDTDERFWAAAALYAATGTKSYVAVIRDAMTTAASTISFDWNSGGGNACLTLLHLPEELALPTYAQTMLEKLQTSASSLLKNVRKSPYHSSVSTYYWGSNMTTANNGYLMAEASRWGGGNQQLRSAAFDQLNYLLGVNPTGYCFVTGFGSQSPQSPHHRPSMAQNTAMPGMLVGGVNQQLEDEMAQGLLRYSPAAKRYLDHWESYSTNEIAIYWNSPLILLLAEVTKVEAAIPTDANCDGKLNGFDLAILRQQARRGECELADVVALQKFLLGN